MPPQWLFNGLLVQRGAAVGLGERVGGVAAAMVFRWFLMVFICFLLAECGINQVHQNLFQI